MLESILCKSSGKLISREQTVSKFKNTVVALFLKSSKKIYQTISAIQQQMKTWWLCDTHDTLSLNNQTYLEELQQLSMETSTAFALAVYQSYQDNFRIQPMFYGVTLHVGTLNVNTQWNSRSIDELIDFNLNKCVTVLIVTSNVYLT